MKLYMQVFKEEEKAQGAGKNPTTLGTSDKAGVLYVGRFRFSGNGRTEKVTAKSVGELVASLKEKLLETAPDMKGKAINNCSFRFQPLEDRVPRSGSGRESDSGTNISTLAMDEITDFLRVIEQTLIREGLA